MPAEGHFRAFSFVDRIGAFEPGRHVRATYTIPAGADFFPVSLVAESAGQTAAWAAMHAVNFETRPVAGIAAGIELFSTVRPGQVLELDMTLDSVDAEAVSYHGTARADGQPVLQLEHCVGPMMPVADLDDPEAVRSRFELLRGPGAEPGAFPGIRPLPLERLADSDAAIARAILRVPEAAPFFADHFPRRPVLPGVLLMHANLEVVGELAGRLPKPNGSGTGWTPRRLSDVKLRAFAPPGEVLEIEARVQDSSGAKVVVLVETRKGKRLVGSARVQLSPENIP